jgi:hypothetical protein
MVYSQLLFNPEMNLNCASIISNLRAKTLFVAINILIETPRSDLRSTKVALVSLAVNVADAIPYLGDTFGATASIS